MNTPLVLTIERTEADSASGRTGFLTYLGLTAWNIELHELAQVFGRCDLHRLLLMRVGEKQDVLLSGLFRHEANPTQRQHKIAIYRKNEQYPTTTLESDTLYTLVAEHVGGKIIIALDGKDAESLLKRIETLVAEAWHE